MKKKNKKIILMFLNNFIMPMATLCILLCAVGYMLSDSLIKATDPTGDQAQIELLNRIIKAPHRNPKVLEEHGYSGFGEEVKLGNHWATWNFYPKIEVWQLIDGQTIYDLNKDGTMSIFKWIDGGPQP